MKLVRPITEEKLQELERQLQNEKERFKKATKRSTDKLQNSFSIFRWVRDYPVPSAVVLGVSALALSLNLKKELFVPKNPPKPVKAPH